MSSYESRSGGPVIKRLWRYCIQTILMSMRDLKRWILKLLGFKKKRPMARKCFVGFWPWPRAWTTQEAFSVASSAKKDQWSIHLTEPVSEDQAKVFREVACEYVTAEFELQLCADGLFLYRDNAIEDAIIEAAEKDKASPDPMMGGIDEIMSASGAAYRHYMPALNILFALVESELHCHGRNTYLYWAEPIGRTDMVRVKYAQSPTEQSSLTNFGEVNEMQIQRFGDERSIGARMDGVYYKEVPKAFMDACVTFKQAYGDNRLWSFLAQYSTAWSNLQTELYESSLSILWSLIERDLVDQASQLIAQLPAGSVQQVTSSGIQTLSNRQESRIRAILAQGDSPMAGQLISILNAHQVSVHQYLDRVKNARNDFQHKGIPVPPDRCRDALSICSDIAQRNYSIELNCRLQANAHLGITC